MLNSSSGIQMKKGIFLVVDSFGDKIYFENVIFNFQNKFETTFFS